MKKPLLFITNVLIFALGMQLSTLFGSKFAFFLGGVFMILVSTIVAKFSEKEEKENA